MVHNLPENFNISDFDVFHSALLYSSSLTMFFGVSSTSVFVIAAPVLEAPVLVAPVLEAIFYSW